MSCTSSPTSSALSAEPPLFRAGRDPNDPDKPEPNLDADSESPNADEDVDTLTLEHAPDATLVNVADTFVKLVDADLDDQDTENLQSYSEPITQASPNISTHGADIGLGTPSNERSGEDPVTINKDSPLRLDIADLFDFTDTYWVHMIEKQATAGLANEAELCELLGQDGAEAVWAAQHAGL